jgi:hypothetical protein
MDNVDVKVDIYQSDDNQIQMVIQGAARGIVYFRDINVFYAFIEKCAEFIDNHEGFVKALTPIPKPFLNAFNDNAKAT